MAFDTFDTDAVATAGVTFSGGNLTADATSGSLSNSLIAQTLEGKKSGKYHVEMTWVGSSGNNDGVGIISSNGNVGGFLGNTQGSFAENQRSWGYFSNGHVVNFGSSLSAVNASGFSVSATIGIEIDLDNGSLWFTTNGIDYVGPSGIPNPATNTDGFTIQPPSVGRYFPACNLSGNGAKFTLNAGASAFTFPVPSGFTAGWPNTTAGSYFGTLASTGASGSTDVYAPAGTGDFQSASPYTATLTGTIGTVILGMCATDGIENLNCAIYDATGVGGLPGALLGTSTNTYTTSVATFEAEFDFAGVNVTMGNVYWICPGSSSSGGLFNIVWGIPLTDGLATLAMPSYPAFNSPFGASPTLQNYRIPALVNVAAGQVGQMILANI